MMKEIVAPWENHSLALIKSLIINFFTCHSWYKNPGRSQRQQVVFHTFASGVVI